MFSKIGAKALHPSLEKILAFSKALNFPEKQFKSIHIAGTNGKGSTSHILAATFQQAGYKTGLYTSPHLIDIRERIRINGIPFAQSLLTEFINTHMVLIDEIKPSYFELNVAMAFWVFAKEAVDIAIIETGLGGTWDSTNIITPELSVITNISLDHTQILGDTIALIAGEKAGIIKPNVPVVIGTTQEETNLVFSKTAILNHTALYYADSMYDAIFVEKEATYQVLKIVDKTQMKVLEVRTDLLGDFQAKNIITALACMRVLQTLGWRVDEAICIEALKTVKQTTGLRGRWDWVQTGPNIILDVAHNPDGIATIVAQLTHTSLKNSNLHIIIGFVSDKDVPQALALLPKKARYYFTQAQVPRALPAESLQQTATDLGMAGILYPSVADAVRAARNEASSEDTILITGSFFIVGEALDFLENKQ
ncbi:dihydrofolate synthase [Taibaiella sp. KBW10]|nr:dihydrofolate synthase [Taibaiella sp. KBW10]